MLGSAPRVLAENVREAEWTPDGSALAIVRRVDALEQLEQSRGYAQDLDGGAPRPFTPEGVRSRRWWALPVSPDGTSVIAEASTGEPAIYRIAGGAPQAIPGLTAGDLPLQWHEDGRSLFVARGQGLPWTIDRLDLATGQRTHALEVRAREKAGLRLSILAISPNGRHYVHAYSRLLTDLFVVTGLH